MEVCASSHHWAREIAKLGHQIRLIAPAYVKPFVKRQKNDAADVEAICEVAQRPTMRFVAIKTEEQHAASLVFRARDLLVRQRTQIINAIRDHLVEFLDRIADTPAMAQSILQLVLEQLQSLDEKSAHLDQELAHRVKADTEAKRLMTIPGIGPVSATALAALAPTAQAFKKGRDFAAWLGLTPLQRSTGGKQKLGETSRMGERTLRRLLIIGASASVRWARRRALLTYGS
jgi:transposase